MKYTIQEIAEVLRCDGRILDGEATVSELLTDSRSLSMPHDTLFFALHTPNDDGHNYIAGLYDRGVRNFVVEREYMSSLSLLSANFLVVDNTLDALQSLATFHRRRFRDIPVIGITGSRGKTTVKEWLYQLLKDDFHIVRSPRSYNSQIGVPLSLWDIDVNTTLAIIEAGISTKGEMANLQAMIRPTIGIITNLGAEHNEGFSSMAEKAAEKVKIVTSCECVVYSADDTLVRATIKPLLAADVVQEMAWSLLGKEDIQLAVTSVERGSQRSVITYRYQGVEHQFAIPFNGDRELENVVTCLAVMLYLGVDHEVIAERMARLTAVGTRLDVIEGVNNCTIIADGYTSDYNSLTPAIDFMTRRSGNGRTTVVLSDLVGEAPVRDELYVRVSEWLKNKNVDRLLGVGPDMIRYGHYFDDLPYTRFFATTQQFLDEMVQGDFEDETVLVKGAPEFGFGQIVDFLEVSQHETVEEIDLNALAHNFKFFKSFLKPSTKTTAMVKAAGYGTGSYEVAKTLQDRGADYLAVAVQDEGVQLRKAGIVMPIIVLNPSVTNYKSLFIHHLEPEVYSMGELQQLVREGAIHGVHDFPVHIKIDSGMHRLGFTWEQLPALIKALQAQDVVRPASVFSHLCVADEPSQDEYTQWQFDYFERCSNELQRHFDHHLMRHILNTSGIVRFPDRQYDMVRIGVGLYGITTVAGEEPIKPVATLRAVIISIKEWPAGTTIGYSRRGVLQRPSRIATVGIGYADGFDRHYGNGAVSMWVNGTLCPTVGNVCMDATMIDVTDAECEVGDRVEIFGTHIPIEEMARVRGTIAYEVLTSVSPRVKRVYYRE